MTTIYFAVCSRSPRPSVQKGSKGAQWWRRDVYHLTTKARRTTLCGRDASDWSEIGVLLAFDDSLCRQCARAHFTPGSAER